MNSNPILQVSKNTGRSALESHIKQVFFGKPEVVRHSLVCFLAGGHVLIEDVPGVGKTTLALSLAQSTGCTFQRIQFTSDLMPSDILGVSILNPANQTFEFRKGPLFHQVILADELNRASPRTQSALLEAMNERQVTIDNQTFSLPTPFFVIGTQNPHDHQGTFTLPESQMDRFMMRLSVGYPDDASEKQILNSGVEMNAVRRLDPCLSATELQNWMGLVQQVGVTPIIDDYVLSLVRATREAAAIEVGISPRGGLALRRAAQAHAFLLGRDYVTPDDVKAISVPVMARTTETSTSNITDIVMTMED